MCFMNCKYENHDGECTAGKNIPLDAYCREDELQEFESLEEDNALEN